MENLRDGFKDLNMQTQRIKYLLTVFDEIERKVNIRSLYLDRKQNGGLSKSTSIINFTDFHLGQA